MPTKCANLKDDKVREDWNHILTRLGGRAMTAADVAPRQAYVGDLNDKQKRAYFQAHALWDAHDGAAEVMKFLDAVNDLRDAIGRPEKKDKKADTPKDEKKSDKTEISEKSEPKPDTTPDTTKRSLPDLFADHLAAGDRFETIVQARKFAQEAGYDLSNKQVDEAIEAGVVAAARGIAARGDKPSTVFADLVGLYRRQPRLGARTGTSVTNQAYSTPVPLAYAASRLAGVADADVVYEPTAGNGALLIEANPKSQKVIANEIDPDRAAALKAQGFQATQRDGADPSQGKAIRNAAPADAVIMNPPFGAVREGGQSKEFTTPDGWKTTQIDHAIAMNGLQAMGDNGKAVLILGGINAEDVTERRAGYRAKAKREFYYRLYDQYKVTDHFTVDGSLYEKQGAGWPVDVVVIDGRGKSDRPLPAAAPPPILKTWDEVGAKITDGIQPTARAQTGRDRAQDRGPAETVELAAGRDGGSGQAAPRERDGGDQRVRKVRGEDIPGQVRLGSSEQRGGDQLAERPGLGRVASPTDRQPGRTDRPPDSEHTPRRRLIGKPNSSGQISYPPASARGDSIKALVPANIAEATVSALDRVVERHGSVDTLVADRLGYDEASLGKHFSPEQIDALALGIDNIERGGSLVLGDAGGIGKGRVNAGMLRYAKRRGWTPVFVTETKDLYGDMVRDMEDIGMSEFLGREPRIFMTDSGEIVPLDDTALAWKEAADQAKQDGRPIPKKEGKFLRSGGAPRQTAIMNEIAAGKSPFDFVFTTYNQMNTVKGADTDRRRFLKQIAPNAMIVADEVHNAGGAGQGGWKKAGAAQNRAEFMRDLVSNAKAVLYSSATYAKRPEVMDLYARTDLGEAVDDPKKLPELISRGGVPMQQIVATMLSNSGQYIRRERSMEGVDYDVDPVAVDAKSYGDFSGAVQAIFRFDIAFEDQRKETMKDLLDSKGWKVSKDTGVGGGSASSISFSSIMHNVVNQMLLGIKSDQVANRAIAAHAKGEKPVITVSGTAESFISDYAASEGVASGSPIDISFRDVLSRYLSRTLRITLTDPNGNKSHHQIPVSDLSTAFQRQYRDTLDRINEGDFAAIPVSPIDWMRHRMSASGLRVAEITGRKTMIDYGSSPPRLVARPKRELGPAGKRGSIRLFNAGELDGMIINQSGSTGVSMHAYYKFKDQKPRRMIIAQPEGNIDTQMQMLWRIDRTGQVVKPRYSQLAAEIPAEARPAAVLMKKMASLNANTTGARKSVFMKDSLDFLNEYGDKVVGDILHADSDTNWKLGNPVGVDENGRPKIEDAARKATGRLVLLPPEEQQSFLDRIQSAYKEYIEQLDQLGENALEAKTLDLQARTLETTVVRDRTGDGPFLDAVNMEKVSVKASGRAMEPAEVIEGAAKGLSIGKPASEPALALDELQRHGREWVRNKLEDIRKIASDWAQQEHQATFTRWRDIVATAYPGSRVRLGMPSGDIDGVVMSIKRRSGTKNPIALSGWDVTFAVPSSDRQITFPMSRLFTPAWQKPEDAIGANIERSRMSASDLVEAFDQARKEGRETRHMITGNILAGYDAANGNGQIVNYTTESGELKPGILMKRGFDFGGFMASRKVAFKTPDQITTFLEGKPLATVTSTDSVITLRKQRGGWMIETPASRSVGGKYYTEPSVREAVKPSEFEHTGKVMKVEGLNRGQIHSAVEALQKLGAVFTTDTEQEKALEIIRGGPPKDAGAQYSIRRPRIEARETGPSDSEPQRLTPAAQAKRAELIEELRGIVRHVVGPHVDVEFYDKIMLDAEDTPGWGSYGAEAKTASGAYLPADRIIQLALSDPRYAGIEESSAFHEAWHAVEHLLMDNRERKLAENPREVDRLREIISQQFGFTREQAAEMAGSEVRAQAFEVYRAAREAGARDFAGMHVGIRRFFEKIYNLLRRVRNWLTGHGFKTMDDIFERAYRGEFAEREAAPLKTPQEFVDGRASVRAPDDHVVRIMRELAKNDDLFGYPKSQARDFSTVLHDVDPTVKYSGTVTDADALDHGATRGHIVESSSGKEERSAIIYEDDARVWVSLPGRETGTGGSAIYAAIADYAFNNGKVFIGDPAGLTLTGLQRRTEAMLSSALKHGTTSHLEPHPFQVDPPDHYRSSGVVPLRWTAGDDIGNIRSLIETSVDLLAHHVPEIRNASYDFASGTFRTGEGKPITDGAFREWRHTSPGVRAASAGRRTLKRGILLDTILREEGGERPGLLERLVRQSDKLVAGSQLAGAFYSIRSDGAPGRRSGPVMPNVRPTSPRSGRGGLTMPHESVRTAWRDPTLTRRERLSTAIDAMLLRPSRALWDKFIDLSRLQRAAELASGENIAENLDVHLAATLYPGRAGERMKDAALKLYSPLFNAMKERGVTRDDLHEYLYARHAPERNKQIRKIDPNNNAGSGMTDDEAAEIMARFADRSGDFEAVADLVDRIVAHNRDLDESAGLESPETIDAWRKTYKFYVPLKGAEASESEQIEIGSPPVGQGFDVRRPESRRALGRFSRADDILDNLLDQTQRTIIRAEKNRVGSAFLRFAQANPSPLYKIGLAEKERRINPKTGLVETYTKVASSEAPHVFAVKEGGETYHIQIEHEGLLTALKNLGMERLPGFMRPIAAYTRWYASLQTAKNPEFMLTNFMRDLQDAAFNLTAEQKAGFRTAFTKHIINGKALLAVMHAHVKDADNKLGRWAKDKDPKLAKLYDEWRLEGGKISTFGYKDLEAIKKDIERELAERTRRGVKKLGVRAWRTIDPFQGYVVKAFEGISDVSESTTRFAIYAAARDVGLSKAQAAKAARSMTVDFSMKGTAGPYIQALYAFANPQIQGTVNLVQRLAKSKRMRRAFLGVAGIGFMLAVWNLMAAPDDDDGKNLYAKRPYWEREKNFIFYFPGQEKPLSIPAAKVPMGYALQIAMMMGENAAMAMMGKTDPLEALGNWLGTLAKSFNPLGGEGSLFSWRTWLAMASPTATDLPLELALNKNWLGYPIHPNEGPWTKGTPHSEQSKASTSPTAASAARLINRATGGSIFQKGAVDLYPDDIEYIVGWATGGFGRFMKNNFDMFYNIATGNETPVEKIPFARRFLIPGESIQVEKNDFYRASDAVQEKSQALRAAIKAKANKTNVEDADRTIREYGPPLGFHPNSRGPRGGVLIPAEKTFREANKQLRDLHDEEREIQSDQSLSAAARRHKLDKNKKAQMQIMRSTRMTYEDMQKSGSGGSQPWRNATRQILESVRQRKKQTAYDLDDDDNDND